MLCWRSKPCWGPDSVEGCPVVDSKLDTPLVNWAGSTFVVARDGAEMVVEVGL